jgi:hypothetical protein
MQQLDELLRLGQVPERFGVVALNLGISEDEDRAASVVTGSRNTRRPVVRTATLTF